MINPDTEQVFKMSNYFSQSAKALETFIDANELTLGDKERNDLYDRQIELLRIAGEINMAGVSLVFEDVKSSITQMEEITTEVKKTVNKALIVQDVIELAASLAGIGTAILLKDTKMIEENAGKAVEVVKAIRSKEKAAKGNSQNLA